MDNFFTKKLDTYFKSTHKDWQNLLYKVKELSLLNEKVLAFLDVTMIPHCQVANFTEHCLTLIVTNSSMATLLRFQLSDLLKKFQRDPLLKTIKEIKYKVRPLTFKDPILRTQDPKVKSMKRMSKKTADMIKNSAKSLTDQRLKEIMERIAGYVEK